MALAATVVWEVRTAGSDTACSGGYVAGGGGTDYSQQDAAQYTGTNLVIDGAVNTKVTSATHNFVAADVGNLMRITAGSGFTTGFFQIVSVAANAATLDRSAGTLGSTAGTFAVGGALATPGLAVGSMVAGNIIYAKGSYTSTTNTANVAGGRLDFNVAGTQVAWNRFIGYTTTRTDGGKYTITHGATFTTDLITTGPRFNEIKNLALVGNATAATRAMSLSGQSVRVSNLKVSGYNAGSNNIVAVASEVTLKDFEISGGATGGSAALLIYGFANTIMDGWVHGNAGVGVSFSSASTSSNIQRVISTDHTTANGYGFYMSSSGEFNFFECVGWNNAGGDWFLNNSTCTAVCVRCVSGGGGGYNWDNLTGPDSIALYYCAAKTNTTALYRTTPNTNVGLVTLTGDPFTNQAAGDYSPDNTASEGAALRGVTETIFSLTTTRADIGPAQHQDTGGGAGGTGPNVIVSSGAGSRGGSW